MFFYKNTYVFLKWFLNMIFSFLKRILLVVTIKKADYLLPSKSNSTSLPITFIVAETTIPSLVILPSPEVMV